MDNAITWEDDYRERSNPELFTKLLREAVPVLQHVGWKVLETGEGYAKTLLPLNYESTNQHGTHQAALIVLAGNTQGELPSRHCSVEVQSFEFIHNVPTMVRHSGL